MMKSSAATATSCVAVERETLPGVAVKTVAHEGYALDPTCHLRLSLIIPYVRASGEQAG